MIAGPVAVAGAGGFIGAALVSALARAGVASLGFGREGLSGAGPLAALVWAAGSRAGTEAELRAMHVEAPVEALASAARRGARRLVYLSSGEVYGSQDVPFAEDAPRLGTSAYAMAKRAGEDATRAAGERLGVAVFVLRPAVVYGRAQRGPMLLPALTAALRAGQRFPMTGGAQTRDFLHVRDLASLVLRCLEEGAPAGLYNAGTGVEHSVRAAAEGLARRLGRPELLEVGALPYREGELMRYALDPTRARARLGFVAAVDLERGLDELACPPGQEAADA